MRRVENLLNSQQRDVGEFDSAAAGVAVAQGESSVRLVIDRTSWPTRAGVPPESEVIRCQVWISFDNGSNWELLAGVGTEGGDYFNRFGTLVDTTTLTVGLPQPNNPSRRLRVRTNVRSRLTTACHLNLA